jgi:hypothetical protein
VDLCKIVRVQLAPGRSVVHAQERQMLEATQNERLEQVGAWDLGGWS